MECLWHVCKKMIVDWCGMLVECLLNDCGCWWNAGGMIAECLWNAGGMVRVECFVECLWNACGCWRNAGGMIVECCGMLVECWRNDCVILVEY